MTKKFYTTSKEGIQCAIKCQKLKYFVCAINKIKYNLFHPQIDLKKN